MCYFESFIKNKRLLGWHASLVEKTNFQETMRVRVVCKLLYIHSSPTSAIPQIMDGNFVVRALEAPPSVTSDATRIHLKWLESTFLYPQVYLVLFFWLFTGF